MVSFCRRVLKREREGGESEIKKEKGKEHIEWKKSNISEERERVSDVI